MVKESKASRQMVDNRETAPMKLLHPKRLKPWMSATLLTSLALFFGAAVMYVILNQRVETTDEPAAKPVEQEFSTPESVAARGYLEPKGEVIKLSAPAFMEGARVQKLMVKRGDRVKKGDVVAILDSRDRLQAALQSALVAVQVAQARVEQTKAGAKRGEINAQQAEFLRTRAELDGQITTQRATIARLAAELANAQTECRRYEFLVQEGATSASQRDNVCLKETTARESLREAQANFNRTVETIERQVREAQATLEAVSEVRPVDVQVAIEELAKARADAQQAAANLDLSYVRAPFSGQILKINTWEGEIVGNDGIASLGDTEEMYVSAEVYETDISRVKVGQPAIVSSSGVIGNLSGVVDEIGLLIAPQDVLGTDPVADADARVVEVKIRLNPEDSRRVTGLTNLQLNVIIETSVQPK